MDASGVTPIRTWRGLYHAYGREVYRYARCLTGSHDGAVELIRRVRLRMGQCGRDPLLWLRRALTQEAEDTVETDVEPGTLDWVLAELPATRKTVWILREIEHLSHEDIGTIVGCKTNVSRSRYHRAKAHVDRKRDSHWAVCLDGVTKWDAPPIDDLEPEVIPIDRTRWRRATVLRVAGAGALVVALLLVTRPAGAGRSSLEFSPANPQRGDIVEVTYRPGGRFVDQDRLVLRGRLRTANKLQVELTVVPSPITVLTRRGREYRASFVLPDSVVYGAFAVEDEVAEEVDSDGGRLWDLLTDEYAALAQLRNDLSERDWGRYYQVAREATERYPESSDAWAMRGFVELMFDGDSVLPQHNMQYERLKTRPDTTVEHVAGLYWYALTVLRDGSEAQPWENLLREREPSHHYLNLPVLLRRRTVRGLSETMREYTREPGSTSSLVSIRLPDVPGLRELLSGEVTVVAQWTRFTTSAREALDRLELLQTDVPIVIVTRDAQNPPTTITVLRDQGGVFARAFNAFGVHHYVVVDQTGRVRFEHDDLELLRPQVMALQPLADDR